jgi:hypothetical protein
MQCQISSLDVPIAQALIDTGVLPRPDPSQTWFKNGVVAPDAKTDEPDAFAAWLQAQKGLTAGDTDPKVGNPDAAQISDLLQSAHDGFTSITPHWDFNQAK